MKATFLVANYAPSVGGAQTLVQRVAEGLVERHGYDVDVVTTDALRTPSGPEPGRVPVGDEIIAGVTVKRRPVARRSHTLVRRTRRWGRRVGLPIGSRATRSSVGPLGLRLAVSARRCAVTSDVVVGVASPFLTISGADWATRRTSASHVLVPLLHLSAGSPPPWAVDALRGADGCTALTEFERRWMIDRGVDPGRIAVLSPGCDPERFDDIDPGAARRMLELPDRPTVGYVGRMAAHKGVDTLLASLPHLLAAHPDISVLLAGSSAGWGGLDELVEAVADLAGDRLIVRGEFSEDDKPLLMAACDIVAFPSREESFGMVTLEAWAARRPVVAADIDSVRAVIHHGVDGDLVAVGDAQALAGAVGALLDDPDRRERYGRAGRAAVESAYSWDHIVDGWDEFLRSSVEHGRARPAIKVGG